MQTLTHGNTKSSALALFLLIAVGALLGLGAISAKVAPLVGWSPVALLQWAMFGGALIQIARVKSHVTTMVFTPSILLYSGIAGILVALPNAAGFAAVEHVGASFVSLSFALALVFTYGMALVFKLEKLQILRFAGIIVGLAGAIILALQKSSLNGAFNEWVIMTLLGPIIVSVGNIYRTLYWPQDVHPSVLAAGMTLCGAVVLFLINWAFGTPMLPNNWHLPALALLFAQTAVFAVLYDLYFLLQKTAGPVYLSQIGSVSAVVGVALAIIFFAEIPSYWDAVGATLIALGIFFVNRRRAALS